MDIEKEKKLIREYCEQSIRTIDACKGFEEHVLFVADNKICLFSNTFDGCMSLLQKVARFMGEKYKLIGYHHTSISSVKICYECGEFEIELTCTEPEKAVEKLGSGKCRIKTRMVEEKTIVCDTE